MAAESEAPMAESDVLFCLVAVLSNHPLNSSVSTHRPGLISTWVKGAPIFSGQKSM